MLECVEEYVKEYIFSDVRTFYFFVYIQKDRTNIPRPNETRRKPVNFEVSNIFNPLQTRK